MYNMYMRIYKGVESCLPRDDTPAEHHSRIQPKIQPKNRVLEDTSCRATNLYQALGSISFPPPGPREFFTPVQRRDGEKTRFSRAFFPFTFFFSLRKGRFKTLYTPLKDLLILPVCRKIASSLFIVKLAIHTVHDGVDVYAYLSRGNFPIVNSICTRHSRILLGNLVK